MPNLTSRQTSKSRRTWPELLAALGLKGRQPERLTNEIIERTRSKPLGFRYALRDGKVPGLVLRLGAEGGPGAWWLGYRARGGRREMLKLDREDRLSLEDARAQAQGILAGLREGKNPAQERRQQKAEKARAISVRDFIEGDYLDRCLRGRKSGHKDMIRLLNVWKTVLGRPLVSITGRDIETVLAARKAAGFQAGTVRRDWSAFRHVLGAAVRWKVIPALPTFGLPEPLQGWLPNARKRYVGERGPTEREAFLKALRARESIMDKDQDALLVVFVTRLAWATGMRRGEILGLRDSEVGTDTVNLAPHRTKTGKGRTVRLNRTAKQALALWRTRSLKGEWFPGYLDDRGRDMSPKDGGKTAWWRGRLYCAWGALCADAGVGDLHLHDLRHTFATDLRMAGTPLEIVRDAVGHLDMKSTQRYAHIGPTEVAQAIEKVTLA